MSDQMADIMNVQGYAGLANPNPYLDFTGKIPLAGYQGTPTDAQGRPIQGFNPGITLNSAPAAASSSTPSPAYLAARLNDINAQIAQANGAPQQGWGMGQSGNYMGNVLPGLMQQREQMMRQWAQAQQGGSNAVATPSNAPDARQAYLSKLANPGPVTTPGAVMQPGAQPTGAPQPSVLAQFLAAHPGGGSVGAGGYSNQPFFSTLRALQQGGRA